MEFYIKLLIYPLIALFCVAFTGANFTSAQAMASTEKLANSVNILNLGLGQYVVGSVLSKDQAGRARKNIVADAYPGTYKFQDKQVFVVVEERRDMVLAIYQRQEGVDRQRLKGAVADLMDRFGEPTTIAHEKLIYWAYGKQGKFSEQSLLDAKKIGRIDILATVKFSSSNELISPSDSQPENQSSTIYTLISSPPLLKRFADINQ